MEDSTTKQSSSDDEMKQLYRSLYGLVKELDNHKQKLLIINQNIKNNKKTNSSPSPPPLLLLNEDSIKIRQQLIEQSEFLIFQPNVQIGKKAREILWRKCYYDFITLAKRLLLNTNRPSSESPPAAAAAVAPPVSSSSSTSSSVVSVNEIQELIQEGISRYKNIVVRIDREYQLDLRNIINFKILEDSPTMLTTNYHQTESTTTTTTTDQHFSLDIINFALETIHAALLSIGDLHRYFIDLNVVGCESKHQTTKIITKDYAAQFYFEAFKLNPKIGMAQNQLGTLYSGKNYDLDSVYYYLYSLVCPIPFELSEVNVSKLFQSNSEYLKLNTTDDNKLEVVSICDFLARFKLIVDIFFYDKDIMDFTLLCHCMLLDLRNLLASASRRYEIDEDFLFKLVGILFFCMSKLKATDSNSTKIYSLTAFLVAICSELIDSCMANLEKFILARNKQNEAFQEAYGLLFLLFDRDVRRSRENYRMLTNGDVEKVENLPNNNDDVTKTVASKNVDVQKTNDLKKTHQQKNGTSSPGEFSVISSTVVAGALPVTHQSNSGGSNDGKLKQFGEYYSTNPDKLTDESRTGGSVSTGGKKKPIKQLRRRRKKIVANSNAFESDEGSSSVADSDDEYMTESDYEMNSDFSSDDDDSFNYSSSDDNKDDDCVDDEEGKTGESEKNVENPLCETPTLQPYSDNDDIIVEEEKIIYLNGATKENSSSNHLNDLTDKFTEILNFYDDDNQNLNSQDVKIDRQRSSEHDDDDDVVVEEESIIHPSLKPEISSFSEPPTIEQGSISQRQESIKDDEEEIQLNAAAVATAGQEKLRYKRKYAKIDPNILIEFAQQESTLKSLKILFDWLKVNNEILLNCYISNPEFIHKILKLLNHFNIDIFTRKVYFDRSLIKCDSVRSDLRSLFDIRVSIPLEEDVLLKDFAMLEGVQQVIDYEIPLQMQITRNEENIMRIFKLVDFGFFVCKTKKFRYNFCARSRQFIESGQSVRRGGGGGGGGGGSTGGIENGSGGGGGGGNGNSNGNSRRNRRRDRDRGNKRKMENGRRARRQNRRMRKSNSSNDEHDLMVLMKRNVNTNDNNEMEIQQLQQQQHQTVAVTLPKKSYLKNRQQQQQQQHKENVMATVSGSGGSGTEKENDCSGGVGDGGGVEEHLPTENKYQIMGKLWLRSEVKTLESKVSKKPMQDFTPYLVLDAKTLTDYASIVKNLVKMKKFVVLIPNAVLSELDDLKKSSEGARNAIRWLENEFSKGSRFVRLQRSHETLPIPLLKIPRKLDRESSTFMQCAQFCNYMQTNHADNSDHQLVTFLTGSNLIEKKSASNFSFTGVMNAISVQFEQISAFNAKYKKK